MRDRKSLVFFLAVLATAVALAYAVAQLFVASVPRRAVLRAFKHLDQATARIPALGGVLQAGKDDNADFALATAMSLIAIVSGVSLIRRYHRPIAVAMRLAFRRLLRLADPVSRSEATRAPSPSRATVSEIVAFLYEERSARACFLLLGVLVACLTIWSLAETHAAIRTAIVICFLYVAVYARQAVLRYRVHKGWFANNSREARQFIEFILANADGHDLTGGGGRRALNEVSSADPAFGNGDVVDA